MPDAVDDLDGHVGRMFGPTIEEGAAGDGIGATNHQPRRNGEVFVLISTEVREFPQ